MFQSPPEAGLMLRKILPSAVRRLGRGGPRMGSERECEEHKPDPGGSHGDLQHARRTPGLSAGTWQLTFALDDPRMQVERRLDIAERLYQVAELVRHCWPPRTP